MSSVFMSGQVIDLDDSDNDVPFSSQATSTHSHTVDLTSDDEQTLPSSSQTIIIAEPYKARISTIGRASSLTISMFRLTQYRQ
jgi:hypothetical protein